ncbi:uracil-DNA glycosylase family protein [Cellulomonas xylanilytica]|uniref:Uracil-DNA glycosylase n=1 Tax=Cellulomonas xylanilytica TaxID=233583 RepID=A0A510V643_9CELL|nr:uracil-DNA glycosylase family protein [Cellulomonas xylanilytica]GEK22328.1 uracil-DNA glycosylase [Cellulomonas xylanilytica]
MTREFDRGYRGSYRPLVESYPDETVYPADSFRVEWGPIFHRGRLDGSARVLVIGQDPAAHEAIARRILVGEAGQRAQGLLARLGITRSYVYINALLYSVYGQGGGTRHVLDPKIVRYRHRWIDTIVKDQPIEAIITLGQLADQAYQAWRATPLGASSQAVYATVRHPTYPESASRSGTLTKAEAFQRLCDSWNAALDVIHPAVTPDVPVPLRHYGSTILPEDLAPIPDVDLPPGLPAWMGDLDAWAARTGADAQKKRATITVTVPTRARTWPVL